MKYMKPKPVGGWGYHTVNCAELQAFLDSLPAEFEILGPGERAVKWPADLTRKRLGSLAFGSECGDAIARTRALQSLATIAPEAPKKRMVNLWRNAGTGKRELIAIDADKLPAHGSMWEKVGQCEIEG